MLTTSLYDVTGEVLVEEQFRITNSTKSGKPGKKHKFTVNLYHTTSSVLINGKQIKDIFVQKHLPVIEGEISATPNIDLADKTISAMISGIQQQRNRTTVNQAEDNGLCDSAGAVLSVNNSNDNIQYTSTCTSHLDVSSSNDDYNCKICSKPCLEKSIECSCCNTWIHYQCENLAPKEIAMYEQQSAIDFSRKSCIILGKEDGNYKKSLLLNPQGP